MAVALAVADLADLVAVTMALALAAAIVASLAPLAALTPQTHSSLIKAFVSTCSMADPRRPVFADSS